MKDATNQIRSEFDRLPSNERQAIVAAFDGHSSYREAAVALGESERTVKLRIRSGLRRLAVLNKALSIPRATTESDGS